MPLYQIQAPNGQTYQIEGPEGASQQDVINAVLAQHPEAGQQPKEPGVLDRMGRGLESLLSSQRTAVESLGGGDYAKQSLARQQAIEQKYGGTDDWEAVKKAYEKNGLLSAAGEYLGRVPGALAEQAPQIAESAAAARLGAFGGAPGAIAGLVAPSFTQAYGTLLEREAAEQAKRGESVDPSRLKAAALAVPYSAMDVAATLIPMGKGIVKSVFGEEVAKLLTRGATKEAELAAAKKITSEGFGRTLGMGLAKGAAFEIPSEVGQQMIERVQAGLPLLNDDAMEEYGKTAFSTTMLAPIGGVGRFSEKSAARSLIQGEEQRLSAERRAAEAKAEEDRRATPEYAREIEQKYMEAEKQKQAMLAQVKKLDETSPTYEADRQANKELHKQIEAFTNEVVKPLAEQYNAVKPALAKMAEQDRLAKTTPEDTMLDYLGIKMPEPGVVKPPAMRTVVDEFGRISEEPVEKPPTVSELAKYAAGQIQSARESGQFMTDDYIGYLMNDPAKAAEIAKNRTPLPGLDKREASIVYDGLKLQLKERERQRAAETKATMEERAALLKAPVLPDEEQKYDEIMDFAKESRELASEDMRHLDDTFVNALVTSQPVVDVSPDIQVTREAPRLRERIEDLMAQADQADREYRTARAARERGAAAEAFDRARTAIKQLQAMEESGGPYAKAFIGARRAQFEVMAKIEDVTDQLRSAQTLGGENKAMASSTEQSLSNEAARQRAAYITNVLQEAALHRRAQGLPALTQDEAIKASSKMYDTFNDWVERAKVQMPREELTDAQKNLEPTRQRVNKNKQTISNYTLFDAETNGPAELTIIRQPDGTVFRVFASYPDGGRTEFDNKYDKRINDKAIIQKFFLDTEMFTLGRQIAPGQQRISPAEIRHFQERLNAVRSQLFERPETKIQTESPLLRTQFATSEAEKVAEARGETAATLGGELRRRTEYVRNKMARMQLTPQNLGKSWLGTRNALNAAADVMDAGNATRDFLDAVEPVVDAVLGQRSVPPADLQAIRDAIAAARPTAIEQKEAGQKGLFPEIEEDLGYIRMTPANFAKSPKIKPVWEALDRVRALAKAEASKQAITKQRLQAGNAVIERIKGAMDAIENSTKFFMKNANRYSPTELAKALVPKIEVGTTPEEKALMTKYVTQPGALTEKERHEADRILYQYRTQHLPEYQQRLNEALIMLSKGQQIDALDNELYSHMAGVNKAQKEAAQAVRERIAVYKKAIEDIENTLRASVALTPEQRKILDQQKQVQRARGDYQAAVEKAISKSYAEMNKTLAELLDPEIAATEKAIAAARKTLDQEKAELDKIQKRVQAVLEQPEGKDRMQLATYEQFKYEEKAAIIKDLEDQLAKEEEHLRNVYEARHDELDSAQAVAMAMADKQVKEERHYLEIMERQLADMRGDKILDKPNLYPFSAQRMQANIDAQKAAVKTAETRAADIKERVKTDNEKVQEFVQKNKLPGIRRTGGVVEPLLTEEQKRAEKLRKEAENQFNTMTESERSAAVKQIQLDSIDQEVGGLIAELGAYEHLPNDPNTLKALIEDENTRPQLLAEATAKAGILQNIETLEAQRDTIEAGKPSRKPRPATAPTTAVQSAQMAFRTGDAAARSEREFQQMSRSEQRAANLAALQAVGKKAAPEPKPSKRKQGRMLDENIGLFEDYEAPDLKNLFRTSTKPGAGLKEANVSKIADQVMEGWERVPQVAVVADESGLPPAIQEQARKQNKLGQIPGVFDPNTETVYLVASNLKDGEDVALTIAHEVLGHYGLRAMLGKDYSNMMQRIYDGNENVRKQAAVKMEKEKLSQDVAVEEVLAEMAEKGDMANSHIRNALRNIYYAIKQWFAQKLGFTNVSDNEVKQLLANARRYVKKGKGPIGLIEKGDIVFRTTPTYANDDMRDVGATADKFVAKNKGTWESVKAASGGWLGAETMLVDRFAGLEKLSKLMDPLKGSQMMFYARMYDQRMNFVAQAVEHGAPSIVEKTRRDGQTERLIEAKEGPNIKGVVNILKEANKYVGNGEAVNRIFTLYMSAIRAREKGFDSLHFGDNLTEADLKQAFNKVSANPALKDIFDRARSEYNAYNRNLIDFLVQTGAISKGTAAVLTANNDYIPWYRERNGVAEMIIGNETPVRIGSIAEQPYLHELVGGDAPILDFLTSSVQNTNMIADMGLRNLATKNTVFEMVDLGAAKIVKSGTGPNVVKFKDNGEEKVAEVSGLPGIPGDIIVKGMEGIPTQMPAIVRAMSVPSRLLRKAVTLSPLYMGKQLFRDSLAAPIVSGANFTPIVGALKEISGTAKTTLERRGIVGGQQFTGTSEDITKILRDLASDKTHWMAGLAKAEALGMEADALTRRAQYNSYIEQGLSEMEATLMALESMNFNKRGASPSIHWVNAMIPFFNAQIQGLNVLYKAMFGKMPFNDRLKIQEKLLQRGALLAGATLVYAAAMQDDEAYQNATPEQKYGNWFVRIPGVDEPVKIPVPFEIGYIFKALPEALYNSMTKEHGGEEAVDAFKQILLQTVPGGTSYGIPQAIKPGVEAVLGKSFYTGRDILSAHEKRFLPSEQYRDNTTEIAKIVGKVGNVSPIMLEELVRGYTGTMGLALLQAVSMPFTRQGPEAAARRLSDMPVIGGAFQPNDAGGVINNVYEHMKEAQQVAATYKKMLEEGRQSEANALLMTRGNEFVQAQTADWFTSQMAEVTKYERAIRALDIPADEKRRQLDDLRKIKIQISNTVRDVADKTKLQGSLL